MAKIEGMCKEVLDKTEWISIVTSGEDGSHSVATWGDYVRSIGIDGDTLIIPAGGYYKTEENLKRNNRVELLVASTQVSGDRSIGRGFRLSGTGTLHASGRMFDLAKSKFSWARAALVIKIEQVELLI